jgi:DNA-binding transcriptional MocR family regulator
MYVALADELSSLVKAGKLKSGDRLPSVRRLMTQRGVSATTAIAALRALEERGFAVARPQSGYFAKSAAPLALEPDASRPPSGPKNVGIGELLMQVIDASLDAQIAPLGAATADPSLFPARRMQKLASAIARRQPRVLSHYALDYSGADSLRRQLAKRYLDIGCHIPTEEILITNGCTEALNLALRTVTRAGDTVAVESPVYYVMLQTLQNLGVKALEIASHPRHGLQLAALEAGLRGKEGRRIKACLVSTNFSNPTGATMSDADKRRLVRLCELRGVALIEDDIYGDLQHSGPRPLPAKAFDESGNVMLCSSFSKTLAPGARIGWLCGGRRWRALGSQKLASSGASAVLFQEVIAELLKSGGYERHLNKLRTTFARQVQHMSSAVERHFPEDTKISQPDGGFVIWVQLARKVDVLQLFEMARNEGVNFAPGPLFSASGRYQNFLRLNCGQDFTPRLESAVRTLGELACELRRRTPK